jgi:hypothetical protein
MAQGLVSDGDREILRLADTAEDVLAILKNNHPPEQVSGK